MAKRRRVSPASGKRRLPNQARPQAEKPPRDEGRTFSGRVVDENGSPNRRQQRVNLAGLALGLLAGAVVYVTYYPSDSVAVENGDALPFCLLAVAIATAASVAFGLQRSIPQNEPARRLEEVNDAAVDRNEPAGDRSSEDVPAAFSYVIDGLALLLAAWILLSAWASSPPGNLRVATNEAWLWVAGAAWFCAARRLLFPLASRKGVALLMLACTVGLATHGLHQQLVSLPLSRQNYLDNPERVLREAQYDAPAGSAERMVFENRLFDGGPSGTFALANSLAAVLLVGALMAGGILRFGWNDLKRWERIVLALVCALCFACLLAARSRAALLAVLCGAAMILLAASRLRRSRNLFMALGTLGVAGTLGAVAIALWGNREWVEEAPASLTFRLRYWRATWRMVCDHPWFGSGPGNFQAIYQQYRERTATEQVAEPHNFLFETLASGGFVGGLLLLALAICCVVWGRRQGRVWPAAQFGDTNRNGELSDGDEPTENLIRDADQDAPNEGTMPAQVWGGAGVAIGLIWLFGFASGMIPDFDANLLAIPLVIGSIVCLRGAIGRTAARDLDLIVAIALAALMVHLSVSGGWTVPGVAIYVWTFGAFLVRTTPAVKTRRSGRRRRLALAILGVILMLVIGRVSLRPVENRLRLVSIAEQASARGELRLARTSLQNAIEADRWSPEAAIWLASFYRWQIVLSEPTATAREAFEGMIATAKQRGGQDPALYRVLGAQQLHLFQAHGSDRDLEAAAETFRLAAQWSPSDEWLAAQRAEIARSQGDFDLAASEGDRALELSQLGGNVERELVRQQIYVAEPLGDEASQGPKRRPASEKRVNRHAERGVQEKN